MRRDWVNASAGIAGVIVGSILQLALAWGGLTAAVHFFPGLRIALAVVGGTYLLWLSAGLIMGGDETERTSPLPRGILGVAAFQLLNPKGWVLVTTLAAALPGWELGALAALLAFVAGLCLTVWVGAGWIASPLLTRPHGKLWFDRAMGALLAASAGGIVVHAMV